MSEALAYLDTLLRARVVLTEARHGRVSSTSPIRSGIVPTARLILFTRGRATYVLENQPLPIAPGTMLLVPALAKRAWRPIKSVGISFFSFQTEPDLIVPGVMRLRSAHAKRMAPSMRQLIATAADSSRASTLLVEAEAKALLARFLVAAEAMHPATAATGHTDRSIATAMQWLSRNLYLPDPLDELPNRAGLSVNQFRRSFKALTRQTPRDYLLGLRMRQARFQLTETGRSVKQVARAVGYDDPSYFSRRYKHFWKHWPTEERKKL